MPYRHCNWRTHNLFGFTLDRTGFYVFVGTHSFVWEVSDGSRPAQGSSARVGAASADCGDAAGASSPDHGARRRHHGHVQSRWG
jgi:hypothetical protein